MVWKIIGIVVVAWLALIIVSAIIKSLFPLLVLAAICAGLYVLYKAVDGKSSSGVGK